VRAKNGSLVFARRTGHSHFFFPNALAQEHRVFGDVCASVRKNFSHDATKASQKKNKKRERETERERKRRFELFIRANGENLQMSGEEARRLLTQRLVGLDAIKCISVCLPDVIEYAVWDATKLHPGDVVCACDVDTNWREAVITEIKDDRWKVNFVSWPDNFNEWVTHVTELGSRAICPPRALPATPDYVTPTSDSIGSSGGVDSRWVSLVGDDVLDGVLTSHFNSEIRAHTLKAFRDRPESHWARILLQDITLDRKEAHVYAVDTRAALVRSNWGFWCVYFRVPASPVLRDTIKKVMRTTHVPHTTFEHADRIAICFDHAISWIAPTTVAMCPIEPPSTMRYGDFHSCLNITLDILHRLPLPQ
jgi:hypothetical protein